MAGLQHSVAGQLEPKRRSDSTGKSRAGEGAGVLVLPQNPVIRKTLSGVSSPCLLTPPPPPGRGIYPVNSIWGNPLCRQATGPGQEKLTRPPPMPIRSTRGLPVPVCGWIMPLCQSQGHEPHRLPVSLYCQGTQVDHTLRKGLGEELACISKVPWGQVNALGLHRGRMAQ